MHIYAMMVHGNPTVAGDSVGGSAATAFPSGLVISHAHLHDAAVFLFRLDHLQRVVAYVVVEGDMADAVRLYGAQQHLLLEVTVVPQHLT